jgi:hypothetical protein
MTKLQRGQPDFFGAQLGPPLQAMAIDVFVASAVDTINRIPRDARAK